MTTLRNPNSIAREFAFQFLYQCERERHAHFPADSFACFVEHFNVPAEAVGYMRFLSEGTLARMQEFDDKLQRISEHWKLSRMSATDRSVLRMAAFELATSEVPKKVVINEAIELAKKFGTEHSGRFVNGILDKLLKEMNPPEVQEPA